MAGLFQYLAFGLRVDSDVALTGLPDRIDSIEAADIVVSRTTAGRVRCNNDHATKVKNLAAGSEFGDHPHNGIFRDDDGYLLHLEYEASFVELKLDSDGRRIFWDCSEDIAIEELAVIIEGAFLCGAAALQGWQPFHGGCFRLNGRNVAVLADSGSGKSTLLLALSQLPDVQVLTDDSFVIVPQEAGWSLRFGSAALRVSDESAIAFGLEVDALRPLHRMSTKRRHVPNRVITPSDSVLDDRPIILCMSRAKVSEPSFRRMSQRRAFSQLRHHRHPEWIAVSQRATHAAALLDFVQSATVLELVIPDDLSRLADVALWISASVPTL